MGWFWIIGVGTILGAAGHLAARHLFRQPTGWPRTLAGAVLAWAWITVGLQILGSFGVLNQVGILAWSAVGLAVAAAFLAIPPVPDDPPKAAEKPFDLPATLSLGMILVVSLMLGAGSFLLPPKIVSDGPIYHLFFAAKWWKAGRIFPIASPFGETAATYFPANGDLWFSGLMTLYGGDRLARLGQAPFLLLAGMAAFATARRLGVGASSALIATAWFVSSLPLILFAFEANVDMIFVAGYLAAVYFGLRYAIDHGGIPALIIAGLAAGLAWGTKPTATAFIPPLLALAALIVLTRPISWPSRIGHIAILMLAPLATAGYWFGRSFLLTGNPLYPVHVEALGRVWLRGWYPSSAMVRSQFYLPVEDWRSLISVVLTVFDPRLMLVWLAALVGAWSWGKPKSVRNRWVWAVSALAVANVATYWLVIPYRTQQRFMLQALGLAAVPLGCLLDRGRWLRWLAVALLAVHLTTAQSWPFGRPDRRAPWELSEKIPTVAAAPAQLPLYPPDWPKIWDAPGGPDYLLTSAGLVAGCVMSAWLWSFASRTGTARGRAIAAGVTVAVVTGYVAALNGTNGSVSRRVFPPFADYQRAWMALESVSPATGTRVAYAGTNLPYYLMAGGLRNDVSYVNIDAHPDWLLHDYHLSARDRGDPPVWDSPRPGWDRIHPDYNAWLANLRARRIQFLVVAEANPFDGPFNIADTERFPIERSWADDHPELFELVYPRNSPDPRMRIYRLAARAK
ncbi:MAG: family glycosyltransferase, 4-amino-4-deoxy-L-arabinose transferase [Planctomycetota bacterium]|nr:family glycosyltransferase, 4-amino-4-deoxy-L-arabinose transferase [Planctomycetota bacterium]